MNLSWIKKVYLYLVSLISLVILVIAAIMLINLAIRTWVFPKADDNYYTSYCPQMTERTPEGETMSQPRECTDENYAQEIRTAQKQRDAAQALAMIIVASPVFYYHWKLARREA
jgi:membrane protein insertase Oxa1/YidC/SpoIIIJ